ncbi:hypothetical protein LBMAG42_08660 [Deltaproteobacteria bacterium]|nr:hypothetical protein LBMAG42_08660 [Deltaproteobacteria bacterium]
MSLTRRRLLSAAGVVVTAAVVMTAGVGVVADAWWDQPAASPLLHLSTDEVAFVDALADAIFPPSATFAIRGREAGAALHVDEVLQGMEPFQRKMLRLSLHLLDQMPRSAYGAPFRELGPEEGGAALLGWLTHDRAEIRGLIASVYIFVSMAYSLHPAVSPTFAAQFRCGYGA